MKMKLVSKVALFLEGSFVLLVIMTRELLKIIPQEFQANWSLWEKKAVQTAEPKGLRLVKLAVDCIETAEVTTGRIACAQMRQLCNSAQVQIERVRVSAACKQSEFFFWYIDLHMQSSGALRASFCNLLEQVSLLLRPEMCVKRNVDIHLRAHFGW